VPRVLTERGAGSAQPSNSTTPPDGSSPALRIPEVPESSALLASSSLQWWRDRPSFHDLSIGQALSMAYQVSSVVTYALAGKSLTRPSTFGAGTQDEPGAMAAQVRSVPRPLAQWPTSWRMTSSTSWCRCGIRRGRRSSPLAVTYAEVPFDDSAEVPLAHNSNGSGLTVMRPAGAQRADTGRVV
jgi:hypothetical protein